MTRPKIAGFGRARHIEKQAATHVKNDEGKPRMTLVPPNALLAVADALTYGAEKYPTNDFRKVENAYQRYGDAGQRHFNAMERGIVVDEDSGRLHMALYAANCMMQLEILLLSLADMGEEEDD